MPTEPNTGDVTDEFQLELFAKYYKPLSDAFIDMEAVVSSLKSQISRGSKIFEIGLGTGYFASHFINDCYNICGIQPDDEMLKVLMKEYPEKEYPNIVKAKKYLQDYIFDEKYDAIISHSSVFLFTTLTSQFSTGENQHLLVFQSFIKDREEILKNIVKIMDALTSRGKFFINIQTNPKNVTPDADFTFELVRCEYYFDLYRVDKLFRATEYGQPRDMPESHFVMRYTEFKDLIESIKRKGYRVDVSDDYRWVILKSHDE